MDDKKNRARESYSCNHCFSGVRRLHHLTYFTWLKGQLITVPNFPAWVCDVCGRRDYDIRAVSWLNTMLRTPQQKPRHPRQPPQAPNREPPPF